MVFENLKKIILEKKDKNQEPSNLVARDFEENKILQILAKSQKNNCIVIGNSGVGKSSLLKNIKPKIDASIIVIDDVQNLSNQDAIDLKDKIIKKQVQCLISTSLNAYKNYKDTDGFFQNNFTPILLTEPNFNELVKILTIKAQELEKHHDVIVDKTTLKKLIELTNRYTPNKTQPQSSIEILDEICAKKRINSSKKPKELELLLNNINELKSNPLTTAQKFELNAFEAKYNKLYQNWDNQKNTKPFINIDDIYQDFFEKTNIDIKKLQETFEEKVLNLKDRLNNKIIAQDQAIEQICQAIEDKFLSTQQSNKPLSLCFVGQIGVGKYKAAKEIAINLYDDINSLTAVPTSDYQVIITDDISLSQNKKIKNSILIYKTNHDFIDAAINFVEIEKKQAREIAIAQIKDIEKQLKNKNIKLEAEEQVYMFLLKEGYSKQNGVKDLRNIIKKELLPKLSKTIIEKELKNCTIQIYFQSSGLDIKVK